MLFVKVCFNYVKISILHSCTPRFVSDLVEDPEDSFFRDAAHNVLPRCGSISFHDVRCSIAKILRSDWTDAKADPSL